MRRKQAAAACEKAGQRVADHFTDVSNMIETDVLKTWANEPQTILLKSVKWSNRAKATAEKELPVGSKKDGELFF